MYRVVDRQETMVFQPARAQKKKLSRRVLFTGIFMAVFSSLLVLTGIEPLEQLDRICYDVMLRALGEKDPHPDVLIVDIDEESLDIYGQWPWPRNTIAKLLSIIRDGEPAAVGVDILFPESDRSSLGPIIDNLYYEFGVMLDSQKIPKDLLDRDLALVRTLERGGFYLGATFRFGVENDSEKVLPESRRRLDYRIRGGNTFSYYTADDVVAPIDILARAADGIGFLNVLPDRDGIIRHSSLLIKYSHTLYPSLGLALFAHYKKSNKVAIQLGQEGAYTLLIADSEIPVDRYGNIAIRFKGPAGTYPHFSAEMVLEGKISPGVFRNKIVLIGSSAEGLRDNHPIPFDRSCSGVEVHASVIGTLLDKDFIHRPVWSAGLQSICLFFVILISLAVEFRFSAWIAGIFFVGFLAICPLMSFGLFYTTQVFISPASPVVLYVISFAILVLMRFRTEEIRTRHYERQLVAAQDMAIVGLASIVETRDAGTGKHILRTQKYVQALAEYLAKHKPEKYYFHPKDIELLFKSSALHDVGKVGVPDNILLKPGPLTWDEFEEMKKHTIYGAQALEKADDVARDVDEPPFLELAREIALTHHEKWDGSGYPNGLKGEEIPVSGRLMALADVYDALISQRVYKEAMTHEEACEYIFGHRSTHFDPEVADAFRELKNEFGEIARTEKDSG